MKKKERRVYVVPNETLDRILGDSDDDYESISNNKWMELAEKEGWVYTIDGFFADWNNGWWQFPEREFSTLRLIDIITYE